MKRVCLVCVSLRAGGTERVVVRVANHLANAHQVALCTLAATHPFYNVAQSVRLVQPPFGARSQEGKRWYFRIVRYLRNVFRENKPDLVLCFGEPIAPLVVPLSRLARARVLVFNRASPLTSLSGFRGWINPLIYPLSDGVVVQTPNAVDLMRRSYSGCTFRVLPNPMEIPSQVIPVGQRPYRIINVGTLGGQKNQRGLIQAFAALSNCAHWKLDLIGDGPDRPTLEQLAKQLGVGDRVKFLGQRDDVDRLLQAARIFAFSSLTEGFPNALAEALAAGCACLSYDCPTGPADLIVDGVNGLLVPNGDQAAFQAALDLLAGDEALQEELGRRARERIQAFDQSRVLAKLDALIDSTVSD